MLYKCTVHIIYYVPYVLDLKFYSFSSDLYIYFIPINSYSRYLWVRCNNCGAKILLFINFFYIYLCFCNYKLYYYIFQWKSIFCIVYGFSTSPLLLHNSTIYIFFYYKPIQNIWSASVWHMHVFKRRNTIYHFVI